MDLLIFGSLLLFAHVVVSDSVIKKRFITLRMLACYLLVLTGFPCLTRAQSTYDGCTDIRGIPVLSIRSYGLNDIAVASVDAGGAPIIRYNPQVVSSVRPQTRLFFYAHECGHHALGHTLSGVRLGQEQEADCWSIRTLVQKELLTSSDITLIQGDLAVMSKGDWTHLTGPQRAINLRACLDEREAPESDRPQYEAVVVPCTHPLHSQGDLESCSHGPHHPNGDLVTCSHACPGPYGPVPCHQADAIPCVHALHPAGDLTPCTHPRHPNGDPVRQRIH